MYLSIYLSICLSVCLSIYIYIYIYLYICVYIYVYIYLLYLFIAKHTSLFQHVYFIYYFYFIYKTFFFYISHISPITFFLINFLIEGLSSFFILFNNDTAIITFLPYIWLIWYSNLHVFNHFRIRKLENDLYVRILFIINVYCTLVF